MIRNEKAKCGVNKWIYFHVIVVVVAGNQKEGVKWGFLYWL